MSGRDGSMRWQTKPLRDCAPTAARTVMSQELFDEAVRLDEEGQQESALRIWRQLAETHPTRSVFLQLALAAERLGLPEEAESSFKKALELDGRLAIALIELGILAINRRDYEAAESYLKRAREIEEDPGGLSVLGVALRNLGKDLEAEESCRRAIRIDPKYEEAYYNLGVLLRYDRPSEAQALFRTAIELDPVYACAYRELGFVLSRRGADPEAESHLRRAIELTPDDTWAHIYLGTYLWNCADFEGAISEFRAAEKLDPEWAVPLWSLGNIYARQLKDFDLAQSYFERALQLDPEDGVALKGLGRLFKDRGQLNLAREYLERALLQDPSDKDVRALLEEAGPDGAA
jgi:tetratricopeptide (TPR) repeat protein